MKLFFVTCAAAAGVTLSACTPYALDNTRQATEYEALQLSCVDNATTKAAADECRCAVKKSWGRAGPECDVDGGAK